MRFSRFASLSQSSFATIQHGPERHQAAIAPDLDASISAGIPTPAVSCSEHEDLWSRCDAVCELRYAVVDCEGGAEQCVPSNKLQGVSIVGSTRCQAWSNSALVTRTIPSVSARTRASDSHGSSASSGDGPSGGGHAGWTSGPIRRGRLRRATASAARTSARMATASAMASSALMIRG